MSWKGNDDDQRMWNLMIYKLYMTDEEMDARELSRELGIKEKEVCEHLIHISRSLDAQGRRINIRPGECLKCGYVFKDRKRFTRPGRCPKCRKSHLTSPSFKIT